MTTFSFNCQSYLDNTELCILEILTFPSAGTTAGTSHWLLIDKRNLSIRSLNLKSRDESDSVRERFFDLGYLKYTASEGIFIEPENRGLHPLSAKDCRHIPEDYLNSISAYMSMSA